MNGTQHLPEGPPSDRTLLHDHVRHTANLALILERVVHVQDRNAHADRRPLYLVALLLTGILGALVAILVTLSQLSAHLDHVAR